MRLPGFVADASLYIAKAHYASVGLSGLLSGGVTPQLMSELGLGNPCWAACRCCRSYGNRFCCSHCRWCSGPIGVTEIEASY